MIQKTRMLKQNEVQPKCYLVDAKNKVLGRVATKIAVVLRGKHKATYTPHIDNGDMVIVINADKIRVTGKKLYDKQYQTYTGYPSGLKVTSLQDMLKKRPEKVLWLAVKRMIPSGPLGYQIVRKLKVYASDKHPHQAQNPIPLEV